MGIGFMPTLMVDNETGACSLSLSINSTDENGGIAASVGWGLSLYGGEGVVRKDASMGEALDSFLNDQASTYGVGLDIVGFSLSTNGYWNVSGASFGQGRGSPVGLTETSGTSTSIWSSEDF
jgi:hypothetical protein